MTSQRVKEMIAAASNAVIQNYVQSDEYQGYVLLQRGDIDGIVQLARESATALDIDQPTLEAQLAQVRTELPESKAYWEKTEQTLKQNGFEEYFLR